MQFAKDIKLSVDKHGCSTNIFQGSLGTVVSVPCITASIRLNGIDFGFIEVNASDVKISLLPPCDKSYANAIVTENHPAPIYEYKRQNPLSADMELDKAIDTLISIYSACIPLCTSQFSEIIPDLLKGHLFTSWEFLRDRKYIMMGAKPLSENSNSVLNQVRIRKLDSPQTNRKVKKLTLKREYLENMIWFPLTATETLKDAVARLTKRTVKRACSACEAAAFD